MSEDDQQPEVRWQTYTMTEGASQEPVPSHGWAGFTQTDSFCTEFEEGDADDLPLGDEDSPTKGEAKVSPRDERAMSLQSSSSVRMRAMSKHEVDLWSFRNTVAYWASIFFIEDAVMSLWASVCLNIWSLPHWQFIAMVRWCFFLAACCCTLGCYLVYFQVINSEGKPHKLLIASPSRSLGHWAALFNLVSAILSNGRCALLVYLEHSSSYLADRLRVSLCNYSTGVFVHLLGMTSAILLGEHNDWRGTGIDWWRSSNIGLAASTGRPGSRGRFWLCITTFLGRFCSVVAFTLSYTDPINDVPFDKTATMWEVNNFFVVGSVFFLLSAWISLWMWKEQMFGLGYGDADGTLMGHRKKSKVDVKQQVALLFYMVNIMLAWVYCVLASNDDSSQSFGHISKGWVRVAQLGSLFSVLVYHCILFLMSTIHDTPKTHPYDYLLWSMRAIALFGTVFETYRLVIYLSDT